MKKNKNQKKISKTNAQSNYKITHILEIILIILSVLLAAVAVIVSAYSNRNITILLFFTFISFNAFLCLRIYHYIFKNKLIKNNKPKYILISVFIIISVIIYFLIPIGNNNISNLFLSLYKWYGWNIPIILKLWHIITLLLIYLIYRYFINKNIERNKYINFEGFNWHIAKDIFNKYHIDGLPYCTEHNKQIIYTDKYQRYYKCPDCNLPYSSDSIQEIYPRIQNHIMEKFNLFYFPDINYICNDIAKIHDELEIVQRRIDKIMHKS